MKKSLVIASFILALLCATTVRADLVNLNLPFTAGDQSLWGGGFSIGFRAQDSIGGAVGVSYDVGANTGTASAQFNGGLSINYQPTLALPGQTSLTMGFAGTNGFIKSDLGAWLRIGWYANVNMPWFIPDIHASGSIFSQDYGLNIYQTFAPQFGSQISGQDSFSAYSLGAGIWPIEVGLDFLIIETNRFLATDITGQLKYQLSGASDYGVTDFTLDPSGGLSIDVDLCKPGTWNFSLLDLTLNNEFRTVFGLGLEPYIDYPGGSWSPGSFSFDVFKVTPFELDFAELNFMNEFSIVVASAPVPEPATLLLFGAGLLGLAGYGRKKQI